MHNVLNQRSLNELRKVTDQFPENFRDLSIRYDEKLQKSFVQPVQPAVGAIPGLQVYNLAPLANLTMIETPLRSLIPRAPGQKGTALNWKAITAFNTGKIAPGVAEGKRNAPQDMTTSDRLAGFKGLGHEDDATFESVYAMRGVVDPRSLGRSNILKSLMMDEERIDLGGNNSLALGVPSAPAGTARNATTSEGSTLPGGTYLCRVVALTLDGGYYASLADGVATVIPRLNADGSSDNIAGGSSNKSPASTGVAATAGQAIVWKVTPVRGAAYYAWYTGIGAGNERLTAITGTATFTQLSAADPGAQLATAITADNSRDTLVWDGILTQIAYPGNEAYYTDLLNTGLEADKVGNIHQLMAASRHLWDNGRWRITDYIMSLGTAMYITKIVFEADSNVTAISRNVGNSELGGLSIGGVVGSILDPISKRSIPVRVHPEMPDGKILGTSFSMPRPIKGISSPWVKALRQEYYSIDWPLQTRKHEMGVYMDGALIGNVPAGSFVIDGIDING
jgi:hypothetical protein